MSQPDPVAAYLAEVEPGRRELIAHYYDRVRALVPDARPGRKYAMACYTYRGKGLVAVLVTKAGISLVPFSGSINAAVAGDDFDMSSGGGSLYVTVDRPLPDDRFDVLVERRKAEIEASGRPARG